MLVDENGELNMDGSIAIGVAAAAISMLLFYINIMLLGMLTYWEPS